MAHTIFSPDTLNYVKFYPYLQKHFGSRDIPTLIGKLEYWFSRKKFYGGFFKFMEPCNCYLYKQGDSWTEELSLGRKTFNKIFELIGVRYKSKTLFLNEIDPFKGKLYASYYDRKTNRTFYVRNHDFAESFFTVLKNDSKQKIETQNFTNKKNKSSRDKSVIQSLNSHSSNGTQGRSNNKNTLYIYQKNTNNYSMLDNLPRNPQSECLGKIEERMIEIWEKFVGMVPNYFKNSRTIQKLGQILRASFEGSLEKWQEYCRKIASSKFLMGEGTSTFKAWIHWAIKPETVARIKDNGFTLGDRTIPLDKAEEKLRHQNQQRLTQLFENLSEAGRDVLRQSYLQEIETINPAMAYTIRTSGWTDPFIVGAFKSFALKNLMREEG